MTCWLQTKSQWRNVTDRRARCCLYSSVRQFACAREFWDSGRSYSRKVDFEVLEEVQLEGMPVIPKGGIAFATVTEAESKRRMARGGKLNVNIDSVRLLTGEKAALRAVKEVKGGGHTGAMTGGIVATGIVFFPAAPFFLFMHGKDITIPKGTEITAYVNGDMQLNRAKFQSAQSEPQNVASGAAGLPTNFPSISISAPLGVDNISISAPVACAVRLQHWASPLESTRFH